MHHRVPVSLLVPLCALAVLPAGADPCAIRVTAPSVPVERAACAACGSAADILLGYAHAGETYVAVARSGKRLKVAFNGEEGWLPASAATEAPGAAALRFPSDRPVRTSADAGSPVLGVARRDEIYGVLDDDGAAGRIVWGGTFAWVDSADAARLAVDGTLDVRRPERAPVDWDPCLDSYYIRYVPGGGRWRLVRAEVRLDVNDKAGCVPGILACPNKAGAPTSNWNINIYFTCLDAQGNVVCSPTVVPVASWPTGSASLTACKSSEIEPYTADMNMNRSGWAPCDCKCGGPYDGTIDPSTNDGQVADKVTGMGLPYNAHHTYYLTYRESAVVEPPPAPLGTGQGPASVGGGTTGGTTGSAAGGTTGGSTGGTTGGAGGGAVVPVGASSPDSGGGAIVVDGTTGSSPASPPPAGGGGGASPAPVPPQYTITGNNPRAGYVSGGPDGASGGGKQGACWAGAERSRSGGGAAGRILPLAAATAALFLAGRARGRARGRSGARGMSPASATALLAAAAALAASPARAQDLDRYGGWTGLRGNNASGFFRVEKIGDRYWFVTPENHVYWSVGLVSDAFFDAWGGFSPSLGYWPSPFGIRAKFDNDGAAWNAALRSRLAAWGFNSTGAWGEGVAGVPEAQRVLGMVGSAMDSGCRRIPDAYFVDVFDPAFAAACEAAGATLASNKDNPWTIGSFPDNEIPWARPNGASNTIPDAFIAFPPEAAGKRYWVDTFLKGKYGGDVNALNSAYGTAFPDWNAILSISALPDSPGFPAILADKIDFQEAIAEQYYRLVTSAMRRYDSNHLVFSSRWPMFYEGYASAYHRPFNERTWKMAGRYCDVFANNGYVDFGRADAQFQHSTRVFQQARKPFVITEHCYWSDESYYHDRSFVPTQAGRAVQYVDHLRTILDLGVDADPNDGRPAKTCMGIHWFKYHDEPALGRPDGEALPYGLADEQDEAYLPMVGAMATAHRQIYDYRVQGRPLRILDAPKAVRPSGAGLPALERMTSFELYYYPDDGAWGHQTGGLVDDPAAFKRRAYKGSAGAAPACLQYGPYAAGRTLLDGESCAVTFRLKIGNNATPNVVATIDVATAFGADVHARRDLRGTDFAAASAYQDFTLTFVTPPAPVSDTWEYRVYFTGAADLWVDTVIVRFAPRYATTSYSGPLTDGDSSTLWWSAGHATADATEEVLLDLQGLRAGVGRLLVTPGSWGASGMPVDFSIQWFDSVARTWNVLPGQTWTGFANHGAPVLFSFPPVDARYLRIVATKLGIDYFGAYRWHLAGLDVPEATGTSTPVFEWTAVAGAASYTLLLSPAPGFPEEQTIRMDGVTAVSAAAPVPLSPGVWHWTVRAVDAQGRDGYCLPTVRFLVGDIPAGEADPAPNLGCERLTAWGIADADMTGGAGEAWALADSSRKVEGQSSARVVFTVNSLIRQSGVKNPGTADVPWSWTGAPLDLSNATALRFQLRPWRFVDTDGVIVSPSEFLRVRLVDANGGVVADAPVDPAGALPAEQWSAVSVPLAGGAGMSAARIVFYVRCGDAKLTWDERMTFNIDDLVLVAPPAITSAPPTTATSGGLYVYDVNATGGPAPAFALAAVPAGMAIDAATGVITWTPTAAQSGPNAVTVTAANGSGPDAAQSFVVTVSAAASVAPLPAGGVTPVGGGTSSSSPSAVSLVVTPSAGLSVSGAPGGPFASSTMIYTLQNPAATAGPLTWAATNLQGWVTVVPAGGTLAPGEARQVSVVLAAGAAALPAGAWTDTVAFVNATNGLGSTVRPVRLQITGTASGLQLAPGGAFFASGQTGGPFDSSVAAYTLTNAGASAIDWSAANAQAWVAVSPASGALAPGASVRVEVSIVPAAAALLAVGVWSDTVTFADRTGGNWTASVPVRLAASAQAPPALTIASPASAESSVAGAGIDLAGSAAGTVAAIAWTNLTTGQSGTAGGTNAWTASVPLAPGRNDIVVTAFDATGSRSEKALVVTSGAASPAAGGGAGAAANAATAAPGGGGGGGGGGGCWSGAAGGACRRGLIAALSVAIACVFATLRRRRIDLRSR